MKTIQIYSKGGLVILKADVETGLVYDGGGVLSASNNSTISSGIDITDTTTSRLVFSGLDYRGIEDESGTVLNSSRAATVTDLNAIFDKKVLDDFIVKDENSDLSGTTKIRHKEGSGGEDRDEGGTLELDLHSASIGLYGSYLKITEDDLNNTSGKNAAYGRLQMFLENAGTPVEVLDMQMSSLVQAPIVDLNTSSIDVSGDVTFSSAAGTVTFSGNTSGIDYNDLSNIPAGGVTTTIHYARMSMSSAVLLGGASQQNFTGTTDVDVQFNVQDTVTGSDISTDTTGYHMTVAEAGYYRLTCNMTFYSASARATPGIRFNVNGTVIPGESMGYIRASSGQNENTTNLTRVVLLNANDEINVCAHDESTATGAIYAEDAIFEVERLEVSVDTAFSNITATPTTLAGYGITDITNVGSGAIITAAERTKLTGLTKYHGVLLDGNSGGISIGSGTISFAVGDRFANKGTVASDGFYEVTSAFTFNQEAAETGAQLEFNSLSGNYQTVASGADLSLADLATSASGDSFADSLSTYQITTSGATTFTALAFIVSGATSVIGNLGVTGNITVSGTVDGIDIATDVAANTAKTSFPGFGTTAGTALEGDTVIENNHLIGQKLEFETKGSAYSQGWEGTIVKYGTDTIQSNKAYVYTSSGWTAVDADLEAKTKGLFGIALGTDADVDGLLVRGIYTATVWSAFSAGDTLYIDLTEGAITNSIASHTTGDFVRVVGYALGSNAIYIDPSPDYIEIA